MSNPKKPTGKKVSRRATKKPEMLLNVRRSVGFTSTTDEEINALKQEQGVEDFGEMVRRLVKAGLEAMKKKSK